MSEIAKYRSIFTVGGTVQARGGHYLARQADEDLLNLCLEGSFSYILTARQMGKSSLMVRTAERLGEENIRSVIIDLTQIGTGMTPEQWYFGILELIADQLGISTDVKVWWREYSDLGFTQRLTKFFHKVLLIEIQKPVVIFVDEIDTTLSLDFTDDFFAAIRYLYNARSTAPELKRLSFVLIGVATPGDLIRNPQRTPFNIGQRVELADFTFEEAKPLASGLNMSPTEAERVLGWVIEWTNGHPYLTQRLCQAVVEEHRRKWSTIEVYRIVDNVFFGEMSEEDNNIQFVRDMLTIRAPDKDDLLKTYQEILGERKSVSDERQSLIKSHLKLSGIVRSENGLLYVRNKIYKQIFDEQWVFKQNLANNFTFTVGGTLSGDSSSYLVRQADVDILNYFRQGQFVYILTPRQTDRKSVV